MPREFDNPRALVAYCEDNIEQLERHAASGLNTQRLVQGLAAVASADPGLLECVPATVLRAVRNCIQLGLEPASPLGLVYILPYWDKNALGKGRGAKVANVIVSYKGLIELALRSEKVESIDAQCVYEGDEFEVRLGTEMELVHVPAGRNRENAANVVRVYAVAWISGARKPIVEIMDRSEVAAIEARSKATYGPWKTDWQEMARKTVIRKITKRLPKTGDFGHAIALNDEAEGLVDSSVAPRSDPSSSKALELSDRIGGLAQTVIQNPDVVERETVEAARNVVDGSAREINPQPEPVDPDELPETPPPAIEAKDLLRQWSGLSGNDLDSLVRDVRKAGRSTCDEDFLEDVNELVEGYTFPDLSVFEKWRKD